MERQNILVIEDSSELAKVLERGLSEEGYDVSFAPNGETALRLLNDFWDLVILDLGLPDMTGETVLNFIRQQVESPKVLILTARSEIGDKVSLFQLGCDDYLTKPFDFNELLGRVRALLRRSSRLSPESFDYEGLHLDPTTNRISNGELEVTLTPKEFAILKLLIRKPGQVVSRSELMRSVWGLTREQRTNFIEVHVTNLRKKLAQLKREDLLHTVRNSGISIGKPVTHGH